MGVLAAAVALAGCSAEPGMVAEVEGRTITEAELDRVTEELGPFLADPSRISVLNALVQSEAGVVLGDRNDIEVTSDEARDFLDALAAESGAQARTWGSGSLTIARMQLIGQRLTTLPDPAAASAEFEEILANLEITVSPRYGEYDPAVGAVSALQPDWIVDGAPVEPPIPE